MAAIAPLDHQFTEQLDTLRSTVSYWQDTDDAQDSLVGKPRTKVWTEQMPTLSEWSDTFVNDLTGS